ncbi:hypothetical protein PIB30_044973 [Stylosanthes scabra]|uniref:Uncharacterized protein n=1 Tax=Stylosanthes scabra TaxID=79078 RepID=A0ABU6UEN6_9FABA|nr:hypothetical protein [Stylosanthes scabra]
MEGDYVLKATGPSHRVPFRADQGSPHFLWVYQELFTRLRVCLPFSDFEREVMTRCRVAVSQLHLNGWGFILTFERVCLYYGFCPTVRLFFYIYDVLIHPTGFGYISFRAHQGRKLFDPYEESIQEFKCGEVMKPVPTAEFGAEVAGESERNGKIATKPRRPLLELMRTHHMEPFARI